MTLTRGARTFSLTLIAVAVAAAVSVGCGSEALSNEIASDYSAPVVVGKIEAPELKESSGLAASECQDVLWTHNDAGNGAVIFAMNMQGKHLGTWRVPGARNIDWESIAGQKDADGKCYLLIADIGDNDTVRPDLQIYRVPEPVIAPETVASGGSGTFETSQPEVMRVAYPDRPHNAETLLVHPQTGNIYIVTKEKKGPAEVHRAAPAFGSETAVKTEKVSNISVPSSPEGLLTGGSISPDGRRVMLCDVKNGYELVLPANATDPDAIWGQKPILVDLGDRKQGEGVSYARDGASIYASSEKKNAPLYEIRRKNG